jgi:hypothetical protein
MNILPVELYENVIKDFSIEDLKTFCITNKRFMSYCKNDRKRFVKKYFNDPDDVKNILFLFKDKKELYDNIGRELLGYLDEEYPINQQSEVLKDFGLHVAKNWRKYISINPMIVLLWYVHTIKTKPSYSELEKIFSKIPSYIIKDILSHDKDWFNTNNICTDYVFRYLQKST